MPAVTYFEVGGPPSSPPMKILLKVKMQKQMIEQIKKMATVNPSAPAGTSYLELCLEAYIALITHGSPKPKKTFTELEPVTLPTAASAY